MQLPSLSFVWRWAVPLVLLLSTTQSSINGMDAARCIRLLGGADADASSSLDWVEFRQLVVSMAEAHGMHEVCLRDQALSALRDRFNHLAINVDSAKTIPIPPKSDIALSELCENVIVATSSAIHLCKAAADTTTSIATHRAVQASSSCQQDALRADEDGSGYLTESEYTNFVELRLDCPGNVETSFLLPSLWSSAHCLCEDQSSFCCTQMVDVLVDSIGYWSDLCESIRAISVILRRGRGCSPLPDPAPVEQRATSLPTSAPTVAPLEPLYYSKQFLSCLEDLKQADANRDEELNLVEFTMLQSCGGNRIVDASVFALLAEDSSAVSISAAYLLKGWTIDQQENLSEICDAEACAAAPTVSLCESQLLLADSDRDGQLTNKEYASYLNMVTGCRDPPDFVVYTLFETARCVCKESSNDIFCCLIGNTIDISALDPNGTTLDSASQTYVNRICEVSSAVLFVVDGDPKCPLTEIPTNQPVTKPTPLPSPSPTAAPTISPSEVPTTVAPVETKAPLAVDAPELSCVESLVAADRNKDQTLDSDEYWDLLVALSGCSATLPKVPFDIGFRSTICTSCIFVSSATCCLDNAGIDLSTLYDNPSADSTVSYAEVICAANGFAVEVLDGCPISAKQQLASETTSPAAQANLVPSATPREVEESLEPVLQSVSTEDPSPAPIKSPTDRPSAAATSSPLPDSAIFSMQQTERCVEALAAADDGDNFLRPNEFLRFVVQFSGCALVTKLSEVQSDVFLELACRCLEDPSRFTRQCCDPQNAAINIDGSDLSRENRSEKESLALQEVCDLTEQVIPSVCAPPPTPAPTRPPQTLPPVTQPIFATTAQPEASSPPRLQPIAAIPEAERVPSLQIVTTNPTKAPSVQESQYCRQSLKAANLNNDDYLSEREFLLLLREFGNCERSDEMTFQQLTAFKYHACQCLTTADDSHLDCCGLDPKIHIGDSYSRARACRDAGRTVEVTCPPPNNGILVDNEELQRCASIIARTDDGDGQLTREEYSQFIESYEGCEEATTGVDVSVASTFFSFSCDEAVLSGYSAASSCLQNQSISISGVSLLQEESSSEEETKIRQLCTSASGLIDRECRAPAKPSPIYDEEQCMESLRNVDDGDGRLDRAEFFDFLQQQSPSCSHLKAPTAAQNAVFSLISCSCIFYTNNPLCCLNGGGRIELNTMMSSPVDSRTAEQSLYISVVCKAPLATAFSCDRPPSQPFPMPGDETDNSRSWMSSSNHYSASAAAFVTATMLLLWVRGYY